MFVDRVLGEDDDWPVMLPLESPRWGSGALSVRMQPSSVSSLKEVNVVEVDLSLSWSHSRSHSVILVRKVSTLLKGWKSVLACCVGNARIIVFIENDHISLVAKHDVSMIAGMRLRNVNRPGKECCSDLKEDKNEVECGSNSKRSEKAGCRTRRTHERYNSDQRCMKRLNSFENGAIRSVLTASLGGELTIRDQDTEWLRLTRSLEGSREIQMTPKNQIGWN